MADLNAIVNQLTKLKPVGSSPGNLPSGMVSFFADGSWSSSRANVLCDDHTSDDRRRMPQNAVDNTTWVAWNLPLGRVVTLTDHIRSLEANKSVGDLEGLGGSVDLVGTGQTETTDLRDCNVNDIVAAWFWRDVDLRYGAVEMFADPNFTGIRHTLFLSEWTSDKMYPFSDWYMNDNMASIRWRSLNDRQKVTFFEHSNGGNSFNEVKGWGSIKENGDLRNAGFVDCVGAFSWTPVLPVKEVIEPIILKAPSTILSSQTATESYENNTDISQNFTFTWNQTQGRALTVATTDTHVASVKASMSIKTSFDAVVTKGETTFSLELSYQYTNSTTKTDSITDTVAVTYARQVTAAPRGTTTATMTLQIGYLPETIYETKTTRWYKVQISGSVRDDSNGGLFKREEKTRIAVAGGLASNLTTRTEFQKFVDPSQGGPNMKSYEGKRVKGAHDAIWLVLDEKARHVANQTVFEGLFGPNWNLEQLTQAAVDAMPKGPTLTASPSLITPPGGGPIYLVDEGKKRWIANPDTFNKYTFHWGRVATVDVSQYPEGAEIKA